jgi:hypothetical protein
MTANMRTVTPNQPRTPTRSIRIPDDVWFPALRKAEREGRTVTDVVLTALRAYLEGGDDE